MKRYMQLFLLSVLFVNVQNSLTQGPLASGIIRSVARRGYTQRRLFKGFPAADAWLPLSFKHLERLNYEN